MATVTPNFNWPVPTSTDLVKDGATAIEALGDSIDASLVDLKGGTTGQVLSKTSGTDMDFTWVTSDDANAIQNTIVDAKGDLIAATAADTPARLAVGTDGQILTADSTAATGIKWASPTSTAFSGVSLVKSAVQSVSNATDTAITWNTEDYDTDGYHSTVTNTDRITIPTGKTGYFLVSSRVSFAGNATGVRSVTLRKNGSTGVIGVDMNNQTAGASAVCINDRVIYAVAGDYFHLNAYQTSGGALNTDNSGGYTFFTMTYLGA